jgi:hypothetical protein
MANGITIATKEDRQIQKDRFDRSIIRDLANSRVDGVFFNRAYRRQCCGFSVGRGLEGDYLDAQAMRDQMLYQNWLKWHAGLGNGT